MLWQKARTIFEVYMRYHRSKLNRFIHAIFFVLCCSWTGLAIGFGNALWLLLIPISFVLPHQAHHRIEGNVPATPNMMRGRRFSVGFFLFAHLVEIGILTMFVLEALALISLEEYAARADEGG